MKTFDDNWQSLKNEDRTLPEPEPQSMINAEDLKLVFWFNNPEQQKFTWRDTMAPFTAWIDLGDTKGMWRSKENRLFEEIQAEYAINYFGQGYKVVRSTARSENGTAMLNVKTIQIYKQQELQEIFLILDGQRVYAGKATKVKGGQAWKFTNSCALEKLL